MIGLSINKKKKKKKFLSSGKDLQWLGLSVNKKKKSLSLKLNFLSKSYKMKDTKGMNEWMKVYEEANKDKNCEKKSPQV